MVERNTSLHLQKRALNQLGRIQMHCNQWIKCFDQLLAVTEDAAPVRMPRQRANPYELKRQGNPRINRKQRERMLEQALWCQWGRQRFLETGRWFIDGTCKYIQTYQMPLRDHLADKGWGEIDLVGVDVDPVHLVAELGKARHARGSNIA